MIIWKIHKTDVTSSTNDDVKQAALEGMHEGFVVWSLKQSAGRGRHGRVWESPEGNLYCSVLLRPETALSNIGQYSFVAALALRDTVQTYLPTMNVTLKWPNDVLVNGKKISGILLESIEHGLIIGMGLNVAIEPTLSNYLATSLASNGAKDIELSAILDRLLIALDYWYNTLRNKGFMPIRLAWLECAATGPMTVRLPHATLQGTFKDLDINGNLCLHLADGTERAIASGDVFLPPKD